MLQASYRRDFISEYSSGGLAYNGGEGQQVARAS